MSNRLFHIAELLPHALQELAEQAAAGTSRPDDRPARPHVATVGHVLAFPRLVRAMVAPADVFKYT